MKLALTSLLIAFFSIAPMHAGDRAVNYRDAGYALLSLARPVEKASDVVQRQSIEGVDYKDNIIFALTNLERSGFYLEADQKWLSNRGRILMTIPEEIRKASLEEIRRLAGAISRQEKFSSGAILHAMQAGTYRMIYLRTKELNPK